jgi:hypothetical protein
MASRVASARLDNALARDGLAAIVAGDVDDIQRFREGRLTDLQWLCVARQAPQKLLREKKARAIVDGLFLLDKAANDIWQATRSAAENTSKRRDWLQRLKRSGKWERMLQARYCVNYETDLRD